MAGKAEIINRIVELTGYPRTRVAMVYDTIFELVGEELARGENVSIPNFGTFSVSERAARQGRNPQTGEMMNIPPSKVVRFKNARKLRDLLRKEEHEPDLE